MLVVDNMNVDEYDPNAKPVYYHDESESDGESMMRIVCECDDVIIVHRATGRWRACETWRQTIDEHVTHDNDDN